MCRAGAGASSCTACSPGTYSASTGLALSHSDRCVPSPSRSQTEVRGWPEGPLPLIVCANGAIRWLFSRAARVECDCSLVGVSICRADGRHRRVDGGAELEAAANLSGRCVADHHGRKCGRIPDTVGDSSGFRV